MTTDTGIDVLDCRHPIRSDHPIQIFGKLLREWDNRATVISQTEAATEQAMVPQERFVQAEVDTVTLNLREIEAAAPYPELAPKELAHDWDTQPGTVTHWYELSDCDD